MLLDFVELQDGHTKCWFLRSFRVADNPFINATGTN